jgi:hypothetical protein
MKSPSLLQPVTTVNDVLAEHAIHLAKVVLNGHAICTGPKSGLSEADLSRVRLSMPDWQWAQ